MESMGSTSEMRTEQLNPSIVPYVTNLMEFILAQRAGRPRDDTRIRGVAGKRHQRLALVVHADQHPDDDAVTEAARRPRLGLL